MADENTEGSGVENQVETNEPTPVELDAMDAGWVPKEDFKGEEHKWVPADEFLRRGELFKKIEDQSKQLKDVRKALSELTKLQGRTAEVEYERAIKNLKEQKKTALIEGDVDAVMDVEDRIELVKEQQQKLKEQEPVDLDEPSAQAHPEFVQWIQKNNWYQNNSPMRAFADALGKDLQSAGNSPSEVLRKVAAAVREEFPKRFQNPNQNKPGAVESSTTSGNTQSNKGFVLSDEERQVMNTFVRQKVMTEKEYIESLKKVRG